MTVTTPAPPVTVTETVPAPPPVTVTAKPKVDPCVDHNFAGWTTERKDTGINHVSGEVAGVRFGRHDDKCYDRVVIDVNTDQLVGFRAEYVDAVINTASQNVPVKGGADLQVVVDAWAKEFATGLNKAPVEDFTAQERTLFRGEWGALQEVKFVESHEGHTVLAIGVDRKTPFEIYYLPVVENGKAVFQRVVIDIRH